MRSLARRAALVVAAFAVVAATASPARATPATLKRAFGNILFAPLDLVLAPVVAGRTVYRNWRESDDPTPVKVAYPLPGLVWVTGVQAGAAALREVTGLIELGPGLALLFLDSDLDPLFDPVERNEALVDRTAGDFPIKFGIDYTTAPTY